MAQSRQDILLQQAVDLIGRQRPAEAAHILDVVIGPAGQMLASVWFLRGIVHLMQGDATSGERALIRSLELQTDFQEAAIELVRLCNATGRFADGIGHSAAAAAVTRPAEALLAERARAFQAMGRHEDRVRERERIVAIHSRKPAAYHNLAAALGDAGRVAEAEVAARQALAAGGAAPETWLVLARALQGQSRLDEADEAFAQALRLRPAYVDALRDRAQLAWMRSGDVESALAVVGKAGTETGAVVGDIAALQAHICEVAGDAERGYALLRASGGCDDPRHQPMAARLALHFDRASALNHALRAVASTRGSAEAHRLLIDCYLANGQAERALPLIEAELVRTPMDQGLLASRWTAWHMSGDGRAGELYDYDAFVRAGKIDVPPGWNDRDSYLADLGAALRNLHRFRAHPLDQSLRWGSQTSADLLRSEEPAIRAFQTAIDGPIRRYIAHLGQGDDVLRSRNRGSYAISGMWSVHLKSGGFHVSHVHPMGWLSSACYIELPAALDADTKEGWLKFGEPGIPMVSPIAAARHVRPEPGLLVLFPSYMWHGTEAFAARGSRLSIAFDIVPA